MGNSPFRRIVKHSNAHNPGIYHWAPIVWGVYTFLILTAAFIKTKREFNIYIFVVGFKRF